MSSCCNTPPPEAGNKTAKRKPTDCPQCGQRAMPIEPITVLHHARQPWLLEWKGHWWVCENPACDQVYIHERQQLTTAQLRDLPAGKNASPEAPVCFCFGVSRQQATDPVVREFVVQMTRSGQCDCTIRNPAGRCCLKDFPRK